MSPRVTIAQVAGEAGVSAMTVSNVLNKRPGASQQTRQRVLSVVERLGYVRSQAARGLKTGRTGLIGVLMLDLTTQYALEIVRGIADELATVEYEVLICASYQDATREHERLSFLAGGLVDGIVLIAPELEDRSVEVLRDRECPAIVVDPRRMDVDLPRIVADNYDGMRRATEYVLGLGHQRIAFLGGDPDFDSAAERDRGFADAMRLAGRAVDGTLRRVCDYSYGSGFRQASDLLVEHRPTAIVAASDLIAFGAIDAVRAHGLQVPRDISVVGFDDLPHAGDSVPGLTTVRQPLHDMGQLAARCLLNTLDQRPALPDVLVQPTTLVIRDTVAARAIDDEAGAVRTAG
ncbi:LacI family DNA-binding transcriptional regulator [Kribbella sp. NPDC026611]|uniref:LacI family DNA-binding transcriptional regulator n=1 Tax=Kribbella sp. NPDC026611 TaxID=3154911 RepID=UPI0033EF3115